MHLDYTKVIILILWWRNFQLEYWRTFQLVSTAFIVSLVAGAFASVVLRIVFINLSMQRKFGKFKRQVFVISNKDLLNSL